MQVAGVYTASDDGRAVPLENSDSERAALVDFALANIAKQLRQTPTRHVRAVISYYSGTDISLAEPLCRCSLLFCQEWSGASFKQGSYVTGLRSLFWFPMSIKPLVER